MSTLTMTPPEIAERYVELLNFGHSTTWANCEQMIAYITPPNKWLTH